MIAEIFLERKQWLYGTGKRTWAFWQSPGHYKWSFV